MPSANLSPTQGLLSKNPKSPVFYEDAFAMIRYILELGSGGSGNVVGTPPSTDNAIARYDGITGLLIQNSLATISDAGTINVPAGQNFTINGVPIGGVGSLQQVTTIGADTTISMNVTSGGGAEPKSTISASSVRAGDNGTQLEATINSDGTVRANDNGNSTHAYMKSDGTFDLQYGTGLNAGGSIIGFKKIHLTSAQIQSGNTIPIVLVPAQGAGTAIYAMHDTIARCVNGVVPAAATKMLIYSTGAANSQIDFAGGFMTSATSNPIKGDDSGGIGLDDCIKENTNLIVYFSVDNPAFDGTIDIYLKYEIITL